MDAFFEFLADRWWLIFVLGPFVGGAIASAGKFLERQRKDKHRLEMERLRLQHGIAAASGQETAQAAPRSASERDVQRVLAEHDAVQARWLEYELDAGKLIDYPLMTDMREELTRAFHRARRRADALRPEDAAELQDPERLREYRGAVDAYAEALDVAVAEAKRRAQRDFTDAERKRLSTARQLVGIAVDEAATAAERQSAYRRARAELDGLIVLPDATAADLEQRIAGSIERG